MFGTESAQGRFPDESRSMMIRSRCLRGNRLRAHWRHASRTGRCPRGWRGLVVPLGEGTEARELAPEATTEYELPTDLAARLSWGPRRRPRPADRPTTGIR